MHGDSVLQASQPVQQYRGGAVVWRQFEAVDAAADRGGEQSGGTGQPRPNIENAMFGPKLHQLQQFERGAGSAGVELVERSKLLGREALLGIQTGRADGRHDSRLYVAGRIVCFQSSHGQLLLKTRGGSRS
jgi:hypothetical protein